MNARAAVIAVLSLFCAFVFSRYVRQPVDRPLVDFRAFYCASQALREGRDPYRYDSVATCQGKRGPRARFEPKDATVIPAPVPGYVLLFYGVFAVFPYGIASGADVALAVLAIAGSIVALRRAIDLSSVVIAGLVVPIGATVDVVMGQTAAFALFGLALAAASRDVRLRTLGLAIAMLQPNLCLGALLATARSDRSMRTPIALLASALAIASIAYGGLGIAREYLTVTLPEAGRYAAFDPTEIGLAWAIHNVLGAPANVAYAAGSLTTLLGIVGGALVAGRLARRYGDRALLVLVPPACAVFGAAYLHEAQVVLAIPAALAIAAVSRPPARAVALVGATIAAVPWGEVNGNWTLIPAAVAIVLLLAVASRLPRPAIVASGIASFGACLALASLGPRGRLLHAPPPLAADATTESVWGDVQRLEIVDRLGQLIELKMPVFAGTLVIVLCVAGAQKDPKPEGVRRLPLP